MTAQIHRSFGHFITAACILLSAGAAFAQPRLQSGQKLKPKPQPREKQEANKEGFSVGPSEPAHYKVDPASKRNEVLFTSKAPKETIKGKTSAINGRLHFNPRNLDRADGQFSVEWKSIDTGNKMRNEHMLAPPWINASEFPQIVFKITKISDPKPLGAAGKTVRAKLVGTLSLNGKDRDVIIPATLAYISPPQKQIDADAPSGRNRGKAPKTVKEGIAIKANFKIDLGDYGIVGKVTGNQKAVGTAVAKVQDIRVTVFLQRSLDDEASDHDDNDKVSAAH